MFSILITPYSIFLTIVISIVSIYVFRKGLNCPEFLIKNRPIVILSMFGLIPFINLVAVPFAIVVYGMVIILGA